MQEMTLCFLMQGDPPTKILLGCKRVGFGAGKNTGFGGKIEPGETAAEAAARELAEETGILNEDNETVGTVWMAEWEENRQGERRE